MANLDLDEPSDSQPLASNGDVSASSSGNCSEGLGLLVWLGQLARDESIRGRSQSVGADSLDVPHAIGRFRLEALLGAGAYGAVFRALDTHLDRHVALKLAWPSVLMDPVSSRRFTEEPKTVASLKHRGIVEVYDSGEIEMACFIALELIEGPTLAQWIKDQDYISPRLAASIVRSVAEAIHFAHGRGIVHRDLKPSNILLRPAGGGGEFPYEPIVTDFGLARRPRIAEMSVLTGTQAIIGTDHYMSPEQAAGSKADTGPASDVFSMGVILYELLAGCRPFVGDSAEQVRGRIQRDDPPPIRLLGKNVPKDLETIVLKCLEKLPGRRYPSAQELADDLTRFLHHEPVRARPVGPLYRCWKRARRNPAPVVVGSTLLAATLLIAGLMGAWISDRMTAADRIASAEAAKAAAERIERQHEYVASIRHAAEALQLGHQQEALDRLNECRAQMPSECGIEWQYLASRTSQASRLLNAHARAITAVRFAPSGQILASAGRDGRVVVWNTSDWSIQREWNDGPRAVVTSVAFCNNGKLLAYGTEGGQVVVRELDTQKAIYDAPVIKGCVRSIASIEPGTKLAIGGDGPVVFIVDPLAGTLGKVELAAEIPGIVDEADMVRSVAYLPEERLVAVCTRGIPDFHLIDVESMARVCWRRVGTHMMSPIPGSPKTFLLAAGSPIAAGETDIRIFRVDEQSMSAEVSLPGNTTAWCSSPDGRFLVAIFNDGTIQAYLVDELVRGKRLSTTRMAGHSGGTEALDISPDGKTCVSGGSDSKLGTWRTADLCDSLGIQLAGRLYDLRFSPCGRWLVLVESRDETNATVRVLEPTTGTQIWETTVARHSAEWRSIRYGWGSRFSPDGSELLVFEGGDSIHIRNASNGAITKSHSIGARTWINAHYSRDGRTLHFDCEASHRPDGTPLPISERRQCFVWDRAGNSFCQQPTTTEYDRLGHFRTRFGDLWLDALRHHDCLLRESDATESGIVLMGSTGVAGAGDVSNDGRWAAVAAADGVVYYWDLQEPTKPRRLAGHVGPVADVRFAPDSRTLLSRGSNGVVRFWHLETHAELLTLGTPDEKISRMDLSPDGLILALGVERDGHYGLRIHRLRSP
jgi:eukaryotic-like serine/threonine-protein kinase